MISHNKIFPVLETLYETAKDGSSEAWQHTYSQIAEVFSSGPGAVSFFSKENGDFNRLTTTFSDDSLKSFDTHFKYVSPIQSQVIQSLPGTAFWRLRDCPDSKFVDTEFYQDFARKEGVYDIMCVKLCQLPRMDAMISFTRPKANPFIADDIESINLLVPHMQRAIEIFINVSDYRSENLHLKEVVSKSPRGVIFLQKGCKAVYLNDIAKKIIAKRDGLHIDRHGVLFAKNAHETRTLETILNSVFAPAIKHGVSHGGFLDVSRPSGLRPYQLHISSLSQLDCAGYAPEKTALLFIGDPEYRAETFENVLGRLYGLTGAEARLAAIVAQGISLKEAGEILGVQKSTLRTHMKHIFSKTNCNRQGELITLINNSLAGLRLL